MVNDDASKDEIMGIASLETWQKVGFKLIVPYLELRNLNNKKFCRKLTKKMKII